MKQRRLKWNCRRDVQTEANGDLVFQTLIGPDGKEIKCPHCGGDFKVDPPAATYTGHAIKGDSTQYCSPKCLDEAIKG
jgi:hypothetical protein